MNDEIKEEFYSLEELKRTIDCYDGYLDNEEVYYFIGALRFAYDYITNLQQENGTRQQDINNLTYQLAKLKEENKHIFANVNDDELLISNAMNYAEAQDYKSRCEKASEKLSFIDEALENDTLNVPLCITKINSALNILQNGSEEK